MADKTTKHLIGLALAAPIFTMILLGLLMLPNLLEKDEGLELLRFTALMRNVNEGSLLLSGHFDRAMSEHETLWLYAENAEIELWVGGRTFRYNERQNTPAMFRSPGSGWYAFQSPGITAGETARFTIRSYYGESDRATERLLENLYVGDGSGLYQLLLNQIDFSGVLLLFAMISGILYLGEGSIDAALGLTTHGSRIAIFGFYCFAGGLWCVTDVVYPYLPLLISPGWTASMLDAVGLLLFPVALALMMRYYIRGRQTRRVMSIILAVEVLTALMSLLFQLTGKADLLELQMVIGAIALASLGAAMVCVALELKKHKSKYFLLLFLTVLPVFISEILDGINVLWPFMPKRVLMRHGFSVSVLLLIFQLASYAKTELAKAKRLRRLEGEVTESRISIMLSQIRPHFLYNTLVGIKQLCDTEPGRASEALEHFSFYLRGNLDSLMDTRLIPFAKELEHLRDYLYLEQMRFDGKIRMKWEITFSDFTLPALTVQPIVENAVRHGIIKKMGGGTLVITSERVADAAVITVSDNGVGFDPVGSKTDEKSHIGIENVRGRLETQCGGRLLIESEKGVGTTVKIILPLMKIPYENA